MTYAAYLRIYEPVSITASQVVVPEQEGEHAYVRRADGITYVCPWPTNIPESGPVRR